MKYCIYLDQRIIHLRTVKLRIANHSINIYPGIRIMKNNTSEQ